MTNTPIPPMPEPPDDDECCNSGCEELCVFELYRQEKQAWEQRYGSNKPHSQDTQ